MPNKTKSLSYRERRDSFRQGTAEYFEDDLVAARNWHAADGLYMPISRDTGEPFACYTRDVIAAIDTRLVTLFDTLPNGMCSIHASTMLRSYDLYTKPHIRVPHNAMSESSGSFDLVISHLMTLKLSELRLHGVCNAFKLRRTLDGLEYADSFQTTFVSMPVAWLDLHCLGWRARQTATEALDIEPEQALRHILGDSLIGTGHGNLQVTSSLLENSALAGVNFEQGTTL